MSESKMEETPDGTKKWYLDGKLHREDGPAIEQTNGTKYWYLNGKCHREDGPAVETFDGFKHWYRYGKRYRSEEPVIETKLSSAKLNIVDRTLKFLTNTWSKLLGFLRR